MIYLYCVVVKGGERVGDADVISLRAYVIGNATGHHDVVQLVFPSGAAFVTALREARPLGEQVEHVRQFPVLLLELFAFVGELSLLASERLQYGVHVTPGRRQFTTELMLRLSGGLQLFF